MSTVPITFFAGEDNLQVLRNLIDLLPTRKASVNEANDVVPHLRQILLVIVNNAAKFDQHCQSNIKWIGGSFISQASEYKPGTDDSTAQLRSLFWMAYRFLCELEFGMPEDLSFELQRVKSFVDENLDSFSGDVKRQLIFANYMMPAAVAKDLLHHPDIATMREFNKKQASAATLKKQWDDEIAAKEEKVDDLKGQLEKLETEFNFVGLVDGFGQLCTQKRSEKLLTLVSLLALGMAVMLPVVSEAIFIGLHIDNLDKYKQALLFALPPLLTLEILLVYFFRVVLVHFRSIKAQLLQLELRTSLCQFIQSYSTYASEIKQKDASALEKFESLIFSGLIASEENLPSTFDGTEQLAKLIKSIKP